MILRDILGNVTVTLQRGLEILEKNSNEEKYEPEDTDPLVDGQIISESNDFKVQLTINIAGFWRPQYEFNLKAMELDDILVIKAHLRDAQEEIASLKAALESDRKTKSAFLSLTSASATNNQQIVAWNGPKGLVSASHFTISADSRTITLTQGGVYQIHCRLGQSNNANGQHLGILINGVEVAQCLQSDGNCYQNTAQITEVLEVVAGSTLTVRCGAANNSIAQPLQNRLSVVLLEAR